ncbi:hypothetical protein CERSUDRAFT_111977 [Gelatoporia subvermispora B]|uniref:Large ribosomal subunit protein uL5 C-terminal domain-containing protein n=1 Tax=Ceriporiopsis subvermispora (strain B) TaxID=914234 RepID=M2RLE6_CERS8|nr:hypothetical protein CERSUDRAFT_111977 [Gelatoporia subvermispora B]
MSASAAVTATRHLRPTKAAPRILRPLPLSEKRLPVPHVNVILRDTHSCRLADHYYHTVRDDLMYMTYNHEPFPRKPARKIRPLYDPEDPYTKHRHNPPVGGPTWFKQPAPPTTPENLVTLERIQVHSMIKEAISSKSQLLGPIMAFRAITGESTGAGGRRTSEGVQIVRGKKQIGGWIRPGVPVGVKVDLKGPKMWDFLGILVECVLPRLREFNGIPMEGPSVALNTPASASGVVSFGLPPEAMALFPQIEVNQDAYPRMYGMHVHFITNAEGMGARNRVRQLLSGFQVPFARK